MSGIKQRWEYITKKYKYSQPLLVLLLIVAFVMLSDNACIFKHSLGVPCAGCGMTRAWLSFFSGNITRAFFYHPLFWLIPILIGIWLLKDRIALCGKLSNNNRAIGVLIALFLVVYGVRMWLYFPTQTPMDFNQSAILPTIFRHINQSLMDFR